MKLLTKTTLLYLGITLAGFVAVGLLAFHFLRAELREEVDEAMWHEREMVAQLLSTRQVLQDGGDEGSEPFAVSLRRLPPGYKPDPDHAIFGDTLIGEADEGEVEMVPFRTLTWQQQVGGEACEVRIVHPAFEDDDTIEAIAKATFPAALGAVLVMLLLLRASSKVLWRPFHQSLGLLSRFKPDHAQSVAFPDTTTEEFRQLNLMLGQVTDKVRRDFQNLKSFTENAAHELQTPLALVQSKLEAVLQSDSLDAAASEAAREALEGLQRMRRLNEGLLLLSKIENRQFTDAVPLDVDDVLRQQLAAVRELAGLKGIDVHYAASASPRPMLSPVLTDLLVGNLLSNALRHNHAGGRVEVLLDAQGFQVANTGPGASLDADRLFKRFERMNSGGLGLGLAIAKEVCEAMKLQIRYVFDGRLHIFRIELPVQD